MENWKYKSDGLPEDFGIHNSGKKEKERLYLGLEIWKKHARFWVRVYVTQLITAFFLLMILLNHTASLSFFLVILEGNTAIMLSYAITFQISPFLSFQANGQYVLL